MINDYLLYDPYYNTFVILEKSPEFLFKEYEKDYVIKFLDNYIGKNFHDIITIFSCAKHFSSKEEAEKVVNFLVNEFVVDKSYFEIIDLKEN